MIQVLDNAELLGDQAVSGKNKHQEAIPVKK
jgi:hypothetical protein